MDCIFCKIAAKQIPSLIIYESEGFLAFLDINPRARGHTIIVPKYHYENLNEMTDEDVSALFRLVKRVSMVLKQKLNADGFNIFINNGKAAGQVMPHMHVHIMPRYEDGPDRGIMIEAAFPIREDIKPQLKEIQKSLE